MVWLSIAAITISIYEFTIAVVNAPSFVVVSSTYFHILSYSYQTMAFIYGVASQNLAAFV